VGARTLTCPNEYRNRSAKVTRRISGEAEPHVYRASESPGVCGYPGR